MSIPNTMDSTFPTGTFQIAEAGFDATTNPNLGFNLSDFTPIINGNANNVLLPLELIYFRANSLEKSIILNWRSTNEYNLDGFEVQRKEDIGRFQKIGWVKANNILNEINNYQFEDKSVKEGVNYYYQLKMIDFDKSFDFSPIRASKINLISNSSISVYPNPAKEKITVQLKNTRDNNVISLIDVLGKGIKEITISSDTSKVEIDTSGLSEGEYFLQLFNSKGMLLKAVPVIIQ